MPLSSHSLVRWIWPMKKSFWRFLAHNDFHKPQTAASSAFHRLSLSAPLLPVACIATRYPTSKLLAKSPENQVPSPSPRSAIAIPPAANANRFTPHENHVLLYEARAPCWKSYIGCSQPFFSVCKSNLYGNTDDYLGWGWILDILWFAVSVRRRQTQIYYSGSLKGKVVDLYQVLVQY